MAIITLLEIVDLIVITAFLGFVFQDALRKPKSPEDYDPLKPRKTYFDLEDFKFAALVAAPAVILHEFGHKFVALGFGATSTLHAAYPWLALGLLLKFINFGFIIFVPAYVSISGVLTPLQSAIVSFAGPLVNLILWLGCAALLKWHKIDKNYFHLVFLTSRINMMLFFFNMIPIMPFDGYGFFHGIWQAIF